MAILCRLDSISLRWFQNEHSSLRKNSSVQFYQTNLFMWKVWGQQKGSFGVQESMGILLVQVFELLSFVWYGCFSKDSKCQCADFLSFSVGEARLVWNRGFSSEETKEAVSLQKMDEKIIQTMQIL